MITSSIRKCLGVTSTHYLILRTFCLRNTCLNKSSAREARMINKLMHGANKRKSWYNEQALNSSPVITKSTFKSGGQNLRRIAVLNKLFMKNISDLMATGELSHEIVGRGIEISRVKVSPDFQHVSVFWLAKGTEDDVSIESMLVANAKKLRHELSQLHIMGIVPRIIFVQDKQYANLAVVDQLLSVADFGEDYIPVDQMARLKSEFTLTVPLSPALKSQISRLEESVEEETKEDLLPPMRMDVLGLNHAGILSKIQQSMKKSLAPHRTGPRSPDVGTTTDSPEERSSSCDLVEQLGAKERKAELNKFLLKRYIAKQKALKGRSDFRPELELYEEEVSGCDGVADDFMEEMDSEEEDIEEDHRVRD